MSYETGVEIREMPVVEAITCDVCKRRFTPADTFEWQEMMHLEMTGGYGSVFGDCVTVELDICQYCLKSVLGDYFRKVKDEEPPEYGEFGV